MRIHKKTRRDWLGEVYPWDYFPLTMRMLKEEKSKLTAQKNQQYEEYSIAKARHHELQAVTHNVHTAMGISHEQAKVQNTTKQDKEQSI